MPNASLILARPAGHRLFPLALLRVVRTVTIGLAVFVATSAAFAQADVVTAEYFERSVRPLLREYCLKCHSTEKKKGELDLERLSALAEVRRHPKDLQNVVEQLALGEMPPKDKPQPTPSERERLSAWVQAVLVDIGRESAGDPGPVVLRRLTNAEYTYTVQDLTGLGLRPAREFPVDGAAGEGFMNTGNSLVMSPSLLTKYLDAAKEIASHAVLLPDGIRFSPKTTRRDRTEEMLAQIRGFYGEFTDSSGGDKVNLQGIVFDTNQGGRLPMEKYLSATLAERESLKAGTKTVGAVASERGLNPNYLGALMKMLSSDEPSLLLDPVRARWRKAQAGDAASLAVDIARWQKALWKFGSVGHIGKVGGPKAWMEPVNPVATKQEVRLKISTAPNSHEVTLYLTASDAGDGNDHDFVVWEQPRLVAPGRPDLLLRDVGETSRALERWRERIFSSAAKCLAAAADANTSRSPIDVAELARRHGVGPDALSAWLDYLGLGSGAGLNIDSHLTNKITSVAGYDFIKGWGSPNTPSFSANSSDQHVRVPGNMKPHSVALHPSPKLQIGVGWRSPTTTMVRIEAKVTHAHPECGNGVTWSLELRRGTTRQRLAIGTAQGSKEVKVGPIEKLAVRTGDLVSMLIGPRDGNHSCDLTAVDLVVTSADESGREWSLARDVSDDLLAGNPHADRFGNDGVWHFYTEPDKGGSEMGPTIPSGSVLARWQSAESAEVKQKLGEALQRLLTSGPQGAKDDPDAVLYRQLASLGGPLFAGERTRLARNFLKASPVGAARNTGSVAPALPKSEWGLDPAAFGRHPNGTAIDGASLCVQAPSVIEVHLPAELVEGCEFVTTGVLDEKTGFEGSVQLHVATDKPSGTAALLPGTVTVQKANGPWTSNNSQVVHSTPILATSGSAARKRIETAFDDFRRWFPAALCYTAIVPIDEVVTLTLFYREDEHLRRLMLDDAQAARLDRMWNELHYISHDAVTLVDAFEQLWQYATQDADPKVFEPMRKPIQERAAAFQQLLIDTQPRHLDALLDFAARAYRHALTENEKDELRALYRKLQGLELPHDEIVRLTLARILVAPAFLYRLEKPKPGVEPGPVSDWEMASRLSYFLWSSMPDAELSAVAVSGRLRDPDVLVAQMRRMLRDPRVRRLATEFACQWLHIYDFDELNEKSERHFPAFASLRGAMYEESIRFFTDFFQRDASVLNILDADYAFLNGALAAHYGIPGVTGAEWRRVDGVKKFSRGGILGQATTLAKQSGASRTSPILRGNWVCEVLLGERLPRPPKEVPRLPDDEMATEGLTVRQLVEKHTSDALCSGCHKRIDPFGYALEGFDAIGRRRDKDLGGRPIDTRVKSMDGTQFEGSEGLRNFLLTARRDAFLRQFCRKLLGYALGRSVQLSDEPLIAEMRAQLKSNDYRIGTPMEMIVRSRQFREMRGRDAVYED